MYIYVYRCIYIFKNVHMVKQLINVESDFSLQSPFNLISMQNSSHILNLENNEFFHTMRKYMIPEHRSFLRDLKSHNNLAQIGMFHLVILFSYFTNKKYGCTFTPRNHYVLLVFILFIFECSHSNNKCHFLINYFARIDAVRFIQTYDN